MLELIAHIGSAKIESTPCNVPAPTNAELRCFLPTDHRFSRHTVRGYREDGTFFVEEFGIPRQQPTQHDCAKRPDWCFAFECNKK